MPRIAPIDLVLLVVLAAMWGSSFTVIKFALEGFGPLGLAAVRIAIGAAILSLFAIIMKAGLPKTGRDWAILLGIAICGNAAPFFLINWGELHVDGGLAAVLMSVVPLSTVILAHFFTDDEKLNRNKLFGVVFGFAGLIVLFGPSVLSGLGDDLTHQGAILVAAFLYAIAGLLARHARHLPKLTTGAASLVMATVIMVPLSLMVEGAYLPHSPDMQALWAVLYLGAVPTALAMMLLLRIIAKSGVSFLAMNNYLVPLFGVAFGVALRGESVSWGIVIAVVLIFIGIWVSSRPVRLPKD